jgi:hypothetical protein
LENGHLVGAEGGANLVVLTKNVGRSVALGVSIHGRMSFTEDYDVLKREQSLVCSGAIRTLSIPPMTIFPGDDSGNGFIVFGAATVPNDAEPDIVSGMEVPYDTNKRARLGGCRR